MANAPPALLGLLRQQVLRFELMVGLGALSAALGAMAAAPIVVALLPWARHGHYAWVLMTLHTALSRLWVYAVLPLLWLVMSRLFVGLNAWLSACVSALTGEVGFLFLDWLGGTLLAMVHTPRVWIPRLLTLALGIVLSRTAIVWTQKKTGAPRPSPSPAVSAPAGESVDAPR